MDEADVKSLLINLLGGVLVILLDRLYLFLKTIIKAYRFKKIFGQDITDQYLIVYGKMKLQQPSYDKKGELIEFPYYNTSGARFRVSEPVSFSETKSAKYISDSISKNTNSFASIISDVEIAN